MDKIVRSPLFYVGDKYKLIDEIKGFFPKNIDTFIEPFLGGGTVFLNVEANRYLLNDIDTHLYNLHKFLYHSHQYGFDNFIENVLKVIDDYGLSKSFYEDIVPISLKKEFKKTYYAKFNKDGYNNLKKEFNKNKNYLFLYLLVIFGFNRMIRFNSKGEFNVPVGNVDFNKNVFNSLRAYFEFVKNRNIKFFNLDFKEFLQNIELKKDDFIYLDPPYLITFSEYNKLWNEEKEKQLLELLDLIDKEGIKFAISNVVFYKEKENTIFLKWLKKYNCVEIKSNYISYHNNSKKRIKEVLVFNY